ncbi:hypothetical protein [Nocardioides panzhihuensis]|uniref:Mce-associated membrane protein n=1 Tax=Nocardioides panzhihuensis TaxID=860243 RepID=A0A7Z0IVB0_9ACTN|nr:hypothetical protein [Nocardioides panzhihuensis]NYI80825.1 hypothetical protein [Nocardioides panzhihuensis]
MSTTTDPGPATETGATSDRASDKRTNQLRWGILALLVAVILAAVGYVGWQLTRGAEESVVSQREQAMAAADKFVGRVNTYGPEDIGSDKKTMPEYREQVGELLTPKFEKSFLSNVAFAEATVVQQSVGRTSDVHSTAVAGLDEDSATVLVVAELAISYPKSEGSEERVEAARQLARTEVELVKQNGKWLVDDWYPAEEAPTTEPSEGVTP